MTAAAIAISAPEKLNETFDETQVDRFGFGRNWLNYQTSINPERLIGARQDIEQWLGTKSLRGLSVLDIGSGSGVHSYCMHAMGASRLVSFDYDPDSVQATRQFHESAGSPDSWKVMQGSVLDAAFVASLGTFDLVYSWGVLHHTGQMWQAITNAAARVNDGGRFFISIYAKGPRYEADLVLKQRYHDASLSGKRKMEFDWILNQYHHRARTNQAPDGWWTDGQERGMDAYYDLVDWLGGLPYEVATMHELVSNLRAMGIETQRTRECGEGGCHILVAQRTTMAPISNGTAASVASVSAPTDATSSATSTSSIAAPNTATRIAQRTSWTKHAPVLWIGTFDQAESPERVVPLARALPNISFLIVAEGYDQLDAGMRRDIEALAPNLRIMDRPTNPDAMKAILKNSAIMLSTSDKGPDDNWIALASASQLPVVCLGANANGVQERGVGVVCNGDVTAAARAIEQFANNAEAYARASSGRFGCNATP